MPTRTEIERPRRQARGERRRREIAAAALRIVEREGLDGVTHRRVATEADVPLASTTYYFSSLEELMEAATALLIEREADVFAQLAESVAGQEVTVEDGIEALIAIQSALLREQPAAQIAQFELYLRLARSDGGPQPWTRPYLDVARQVLTRLGSPDPEYYAQTLNALVNGLALVQLTAPQLDFDDRVLAPAIREWGRAAFSGAR
jgi:AcrR family transcriptional regulator